MESVKASEIIAKYYRAVCDAYRLGNVESSYNAPIMALFTDIGCAARDLSGERKGQTGENIDIKLWHSEEEVTETEPFAGVEVKKVGGIDKRALSQIKIEADRYGNIVRNMNSIFAGIFLVSQSSTHRRKNGTKGNFMLAKNYIESMLLWESD